jgi:hypothetical protein
MGLDVKSCKSADRKIINSSKEPSVRITGQTLIICQKTKLSLHQCVSDKADALIYWRLGARKYHNFQSNIEVKQTPQNLSFILA